MARVLKEAGAKVLITGRDESKVERVSAELGVAGIAADASNESDIAKTFEAVHSEIGGLDVLINNAGFGEFALVEDLICHSSKGMFNEAATSSASMVLPVPGSPLMSSGRSRLAAALTAMLSSSVAMYESVLSNIIM